MITEFRRQLLAAAFATGIGAIGVQDADAADAGNDFRADRRRQRIQRPVEPVGPDDEDTFCVVDVETTGFSPERDAIIEIAVIRRAVRDGRAQEEEFTELVRPPGNIPKVVREKTGIGAPGVGRVRLTCCDSGVHGVIGARSARRAAAAQLAGMAPGVVH